MNWLDLIVGRAALEWRESCTQLQRKAGEYLVGGFCYRLGRLELGCRALDWSLIYFAFLSSEPGWLSYRSTCPALRWDRKSAGLTFSPFAAMLVCLHMGFAAMNSAAWGQALGRLIAKSADARLLNCKLGIRRVGAFTSAHVNLGYFVARGLRTPELRQVRVLCSLPRRKVKKRRY